MSKSSLPTPCPAPTSGIRQHRLSCTSLASDTNDDTTTTIDFTRALGPSIRNSKPRRSSLLHGQATKRAPVTIFEDVQEDEELLPSQNEPVLKGETLLCKPARKMASGAGRVAAGSAATGRQQHQQQHQQSRADDSSLGPAARRSGLHDIGQGRARRSSIMKSDQTSVIGLKERMSSRAAVTSSPQKEAMGLKRHPRRHTIWIPEDTTVLTIHPGASNTAQLDDTFQLPSLYDPPHLEHETAPGHAQAQDKTALQKPMRRPRKSLMAAPRRGPLVIQDVDHKHNTETWNVCGDNTGKENLPPAGMTKFKASVSTSPEARLLNHQAPPRGYTQHTATSQNRRESRPHNAAASRSEDPVYNAPARPPHLSIGASARTIGGTGQRSNIGRQLQDPERSQPQVILFEGIVKYPQVPKSCATKQKQDLQTTIASKRFEMHHAKAKQYPVLSESLPHPSLYENDWLNQQEVALKEILNTIFDAESSIKKSFSHNQLRKGMIYLYHQDAVVMLHNRVQASIRTGFLAKPQSLSTLELSYDLGLTKQFITLWIESYTEDALRAAVEVVTGHTIRDPSAATPVTLDSKASRRVLIDFIQTFFIFVGDVKCPQGANPLQATAAKARWEKTLERSLMLVWLLEQAKTTRLIRGPLFKDISPHKSSAAVLRALSKILCPSIGDITRILSGLGYEALHCQDPLDEVSYQVKNLAVDLRDGIMLTHLVELLLYPRPTKTVVTIEDLATVKLTFPDGTVLESDLYTSELEYNARLLSQHLRVPCLSRTLKEYNVQIALSAIAKRSTHGANIVADVTAQHIVSGHRERTLALLWSLVSVHGLDYLVDWKELAVDVNCTQALLHSTTVSASKLPLISREQRELLLYSWADVHLRNAGMGCVDNYDTAFSDGSPYLAIVEGFEPYIMECLVERPAKRSPRTFVDIEIQLQRIGCSAAFIEQFTLSRGNIPHRNTTISNLAFLASRLLPLRKKHFAAVIIQRAWRKHRAPIIASQRITLMRLAYQCADVVQAREHMVIAVTIIQRAFRAHVNRNIDAIDKSFHDFRNLARGWLVRRVTSRVIGGSSSQGRVMGGF